MIGLATLPSWTVGIFDNTAPWWHLTDNSECKSKQEPKMYIRFRCTLLFIY